MKCQDINFWLCGWCLLTNNFQTVGVAAKQGSIRNTANTISFVKSVLGRSLEDPVSQEYIKKSQVKVCPCWQELLKVKVIVDISFYSL